MTQLILLCLSRSLERFQSSSLANCKFVFALLQITWQKCRTIEDKAEEVSRGQTRQGFVNSFTHFCILKLGQLNSYLHLYLLILKMQIILKAISYDVLDYM